MCTAVAWPLADGYLLAFNRDELVDRPPALTPSVQGHFLAPIDPEGGGTWLATNVFGLTLAAMNLYEALWEPQAPVRSRGLLVTDLADASTLDEVAIRVRQHPHLMHTRPFHLLVIAPDCRALDVRWTGESLDLTPATLPLLRVSAAFDAPAVRAAREIEFTTLSETLQNSVHRSQILREWFASHDLNGAPRGVCMHREPIAATISHTQVEVGPHASAMWYVAGAPCRDVPEFRASIGRL